MGLINAPRATLMRCIPGLHIAKARSSNRPRVAGVSGVQRIMWSLRAHSSSNGTNSASPSGAAWRRTARIWTPNGRASFATARAISPYPNSPIVRPAKLPMSCPDQPSGLVTRISPRRFSKSSIAAKTYSAMAKDAAPRETVKCGTSKSQSGASSTPVGRAWTQARSFAQEGLVRVRLRNLPFVTKSTVVPSGTAHGSSAESR